jgi:signal transduction histidine kinase
LLITYNISQKIKQEITNIKDLLEHLQNKAYRPHFEESFTYEFDTILKLIKRLAKRLDKRDRQKKKFTQKLIFRDKQNKEIISAISHEFKNPIAVILGYCETITGDKDINPNIRDKFLDKIHANSLRISGIIDRISISIKLENGDFKLKISEFNLKNSILNVITLMQDKYKDREIILNFEESETLMISADKTLIELVLINLIENAIKYSEAEVVVKVANGELLVIDKGIGIDSEELSLVTKKFYRVNKNIWNNSLGLGLNIVKYILKLHQKELIIHSKPNVGSTFKFRL